MIRMVDRDGDGQASRIGLVSATVFTVANVMWNPVDLLPRIDATLLHKRNAYNDVSTLFDAFRAELFSSS